MSRGQRFLFVGGVEDRACARDFIFLLSRTISLHIPLTIISISHYRKNTMYKLHKDLPRKLCRSYNKQLDGSTPEKSSRQLKPTALF